MGTACLLALLPLVIGQLQVTKVLRIVGIKPLRKDPL
jgi:hypothetical protein